MKKIKFIRQQKQIETIYDDEVSPPRKHKRQDSPCDFASWKRQNGIDITTKVFIIKGGYQDLREQLLERGWYENQDHWSRYFDFKWTIKVQDIDFSRLQEHQIVNHFDQNQAITSKYGLCKNIRSWSWSERVDFSSFYPRCYHLADHNDFQDFLEDFKITQCYNALLYYVQQEQLLTDYYHRLRLRLALQIAQRNDIELQKKLYFLLYTDQSPYILFNEWKIIKTHKAKDRDKFIYEQIEKFLVSQGLDDITDFKEKYIPIIKKFIDDRKNDKQFQLNGFHNIWIAKPDFSSRGRGIKCFDSINKLLDYVLFKETQYVVQKYIENPLLIKGRKFDIRQWVLVHELYPTKIWFFQECYVRFSAENFDLDNFKNKYAHLTNNAIAKNSNNFLKSEIKGNMWTQEQLIKHFENTVGCNIFKETIQPKFKEIVIYTVKCCLDQMRNRKKSFEIFGYDFMIDTNYNTWLIEINSSPSLDHSTHVTSKLVPILLNDAMKVVLDNPYKKNRRRVGNFLLIYNSDDK